MSAYFQMGNDTENLVGETDLNEYKGIILSPVNREQMELVWDVTRFRGRGDYDIVLDPQLYFPRSRRGKLPEQTYFPKDLDTADLSSLSWWAGVTANLADYARGIGADAVASPVLLPNTWNDDYFATCAEISRTLSEQLSGTEIRTLTTVMVNFKSMSDQDAGVRIASVISEAEPSGYYLIIVSEIEPRRELQGEKELAGIMTLINALEQTGKPVLVSHCSSDMLLFKAAGATNCATGKFFNLRRFTKSRYEEPSESGGGQLPYWFEHSLLTFLRQADILRLRESGYSHLLGTGHSGNHWSGEILEYLQKGEGNKWLRLAWRQYLSWFGKTEEELSKGDSRTLVRNWLITAENNWRVLEDKDILFEEPRNTGEWIRNWRLALSLFLRSQS